MDNFICANSLVTCDDESDGPPTRLEHNESLSLAYKYDQTSLIKLEATYALVEPVDHIPDTL